MLSCHITRYTLKDRTDLQPLFEDYRHRLTENGYLETYQWPYTFGCFSSGEPIPYELRVEYRTACESGIKISDPFHSRKQLISSLAAAHKAQQRYSAVLDAKKLARCLTPPVVWQVLKTIKQRLQ
jgi:hypothetical protein